MKRLIPVGLFDEPTAKKIVEMLNEIGRAKPQLKTMEAKIEHAINTEYLLAKHMLNRKAKTSD